MEPQFPRDLIRSQRLLKITGHPLLEPFDEWLYIDNTVQLSQSPAKVLELYLSTHDLAIPHHSFRSSLEAEFHEILRQNLDNYERVREQLEHYRAEFPGILSEKPLWTGIFARRNTAAVQVWADIWAKHVLRYSRRDQLSVLVALERSRLIYSRLDCDNFLSEFHSWPVITKRKVFAQIQDEDNRFRARAIFHLVWFQHIVDTCPQT